jgi:two-component system, OmpR family, KDP operon response regulator KdpE
MSRVLLVEDDAQLLRAMQVTLRARGHDVLTAGTGRKALAAAAGAHPDLVVLDLGLPDLDGIDVIRGLRDWTSMPIIVLSGRTFGGDKVAALDAGADDYVTKPFGVEELLARIRAVTRRATTPAGRRRRHRPLPHRPHRETRGPVRER